MAKQTAVSNVSDVRKITVYMPPKMVEVLSNLADEENRSVSSQVVYIIKTHLEEIGLVLDYYGR